MILCLADGIFKQTEEELQILKKLLHKILESEYINKASAMLLLYEWAKMGRGDGTIWSGIAALFYFTKPIQRKRKGHCYLKSLATEV